VCLPTVTSTATVTPDQVSVGVLVSAVPRDVIDAAVAAHGAGAGEPRVFRTADY
jgi:hypothetical protein